MASAQQISIHVYAPDNLRIMSRIDFHVTSTTTVAQLKARVVASSPGNYVYYLGGRPLAHDETTLVNSGARNGSTVVAMHSAAGSGNAATVRQQQSNASSGPTEMLRQQLLADPAALQQFRSQDAALADSVNDPVAFEQSLARIQGARSSNERERQRMIALLNDDPFNVEAQQKIEDIIRQEAILENLNHAYEHTPEVFGSVTMLYVNVTVNGHPVKAFVDSGAQTTIMSPSCAEQCGIMRLVDKRYAGIAKGVGTAAIIGRVHSAAIKIGTATMPCSFTVMEGKVVELLLGLDMLKRYQAKIDLEANKLIFGDNEVSFLPESELPKAAEDAEPIVHGAGGAKVGAESGAVKQEAVTSTGTEPAVSAHPSSSAAAPHSAEKIQQLIALGFDEQQAIGALDATGGDVEYAAGLLLQG